VGENLHTPRVMLHTGRPVRVRDDGTEGVHFRDEAGQTRYLTVPSWVHDSPEYQQGQIKHILIAVHKGLSSPQTARRPMGEEADRSRHAPPILAEDATSSLVTTAPESAGLCNICAHRFCASSRAWLSWSTGATTPLLALRLRG
jgi:hypothetical protein